MTTPTPTPTPSLQSIFTRVAEHLLTQNAHSLTSVRARGAYRGEGGLKCAVGCLITDEHYTPELEFLPVIAPEVEAALWKSIDPQGLMTPLERAPLITLLGKLQRIHDIYPPSLWPERLNALAAVFDLTPFATTTTAPTLQALYDRVAEHLLTQNARARDPDNARCAYRGEGDLKCAVGCLITDEHYNAELEGDSVYAEPVQEVVRASIDPQGLLTDADWSTTKDLLGKLQQIHDKFDPEGWPTRIFLIAAEFDLKPFTKE